MKTKGKVGVLLAAVVLLATGGTVLAEAAADSNGPHPISRGPVAYPRVPTRPLPRLPPRRATMTQLSGCSSVTLGMRVLVVSADGRESTLPAIREALDYHSIPYTTWIATQRPGQLTAGALASGCEGFYQGVILSTGELAYSPNGATWVSALTDPEWQALQNYEAQFGVRQISWYVYPDTGHGLSLPTAAFDTTETPVQATLTAAGAAAFPGINAAHPIPITHAWMYLSTAVDPAVIPLVVDGAGNALVSVRATGGREVMALTFDSNQYLLHHAVLAHGLVEWVTRGIYLGEFRSYLAPQVDDLYLDNDMYSGGVYRMTAADVDQLHRWQAAVQANPLTAGFRVAFAFNGRGSGPNDPLTQAIAARQGSFHFISHTFSHLNMDVMSYDGAVFELDDNDMFASAQGFTHYVTDNLVTPDVSGLGNAEALRAARDVGVKYTVSDTSRTGWNNPVPNVGIPSSLVPEILHVPRRPTNLFVHVADPQEWTAAYNEFYASYWGRDLTYQEILDKESQFLLLYMLRGDLDPQMYHQPNLKAFDGARSLLSELHDLAIAKYARHSRLPVLSPTMDVAGGRMAATMARRASGLTARLQPGVGVTLSSPVALRGVALSGVCTAASEIYAGKCITTLDLAAGQPVTLPLQ